MDREQRSKLTMPFPAYVIRECYRARGQAPQASEHRYAKPHAPRAVATAGAHRVHLTPVCLSAAATPALVSPVHPRVEYLSRLPSLPLATMNRCASLAAPSVSAGTSLASRMLSLALARARPPLRARTPISHPPLASRPPCARAAWAARFIAARALRCRRRCRRHHPPPAFSSRGAVAVSGSGGEASPCREAWGRAGQMGRGGRPASFPAK
jgi:hypothetical protein